MANDVEPNTLRRKLDIALKEKKELSDMVKELEARVSKLTLALDICKMERGENK